MFSKLKIFSLTLGAFFLLSFLIFLSCDRDVVEPLGPKASSLWQGRDSLVFNEKLPQVTIVGKVPEESASSIMVDIEGPTDVVILGREVLVFDAVSAEEYYAVIGGTEAEQKSAKRAIIEEQREVFLYGGRLREVQMGNMLFSPADYDSIPPKTCWLFYGVHRSPEVSLCFNILIGAQNFKKTRSDSVGSYNFSVLNPDSTLAIKSISVSLSGDHIQSADLTHILELETGSEDESLHWINFVSNAGEAGEATQYLKNGLTILEMQNGREADTSVSEVSVATLNNVCYQLLPGHYRISVGGIYQSVNDTIPFTRTVNLRIENKNKNFQ